eukprot:6822267-Alexandrium_andersonii.AAC.1
MDAARSGLLSQFRHPGHRVDARCFAPVEQTRFVGMCNALRELLDITQAQREAWWVALVRVGCGYIGGQGGGRCTRFLGDEEAL